jgi:hypothetical protein
MGFGNFKSFEDVAIKFDISIKRDRFIQEKPLEIESLFFDFISDKLAAANSYVSEEAICENIIANILNIVQRNYTLQIWSHVSFKVSEEDGLVGVPDFLIAPASKIDTLFKSPVICVAEAKKENLNEGWAQTLAEMIAAQRFNQNEEREIYGIVTTGELWQFGKLKGALLTRDIVACSASENLHKLLEVLNWLFFEAEKSLQLSNIA